MKDVALKSFLVTHHDKRKNRQFTLKFFYTKQEVKEFVEQPHITVLEILHFKQVADITSKFKGPSAVTVFPKQRTTKKEYLLTHHNLDRKQSFTYEWFYTEKDVHEFISAHGVIPIEVIHVQDTDLITWELIQS